MAQDRRYTQDTLDESCNEDFLSFGFTDIKPINGRMNFIIFDSKINKRLFSYKAFDHIFNGNGYYIKISDDSIKRDYIGKFNNESVNIETKSLEFRYNTLCEMWVLSKTRKIYQKFIDVCNKNNDNPSHVVKTVNEKIIKEWGKYIIDSCLDRMPDYFGFHDKGHVVKLISKKDFLLEHKLELISKRDESGFEHKLERLSVNYVDI